MYDKNMLKPQDVVVCLHLATSPPPRPSYGSLAASLGMSASEAHAAVRRLEKAGLLLPDGQPRRAALVEFLVHGLKYVFPPERGAATRGIPTAHAAAPLSRKLIESAEPPPVWPDPHGPVRGYAFAPLSKNVPQAARALPELYEALALVDAIRGGAVRERRLAEQELAARLLKRG